MGVTLTSVFRPPLVTLIFSIFEHLASRSLRHFARLSCYNQPIRRFENKTQSVIERTDTTMKLRQYIIFTLTVGTIMGFLSMVSDRLPYIEDPTFYNTLLRFIAQFMNDTVMWLGLSILVGYLFCRSKKQAALAGAGFAMFSIITYFVLISLFPEQEVPARIAAETNMFATIAEWLLAAAVGGLIGGLIGFISKKHPSILFIFVLFIIARLIMQGSLAWSSVASIAQSVISIAIAVGIIGWLIYRLIKPHSKGKGNMLS